MFTSSDASNFFLVTKSLTEGQGLQKDLIKLSESRENGRSAFTQTKVKKLTYRTIM